jgi:hypothetical protein
MWRPGQGEDGGENRFNRWFAEWKALGEAPVPQAS